jgi:hypothetical protein
MSLQSDGALLRTILRHLKDLVQISRSKLCQHPRSAIPRRLGGGGARGGASVRDSYWAELGYGFGIQSRCRIGMDANWDWLLGQLPGMSLPHP